MKLFTDLIDALGKVVGGLKVLADLPKAERDKYRQVMDETYRLIDTTINMVIIRLGDILYLDGDQQFLDEVSKLDNFDGWYNAEREFRLCQSLRVAVRETETLRRHLAGSISTKDWDALLQQMKNILTTESEVAQFIAQQFDTLAQEARDATDDAENVSTIRDQAIGVRDALIAERQRLIQQEMELYGIV